MDTLEHTQTQNTHTHTVVLQLFAVANLHAKKYYLNYLLMKNDIASIILSQNIFYFIYWYICNKL